MDSANLQIKVTGDIKQLQTAMKEGQVSVQQFATSTTTSVNSAGKAVNSLGLTAKESIAKYNASLAAARGEMAATAAASQNTFTSIGQGATKALSAIRQLAYILPGVGVAGILGFAAGPIIEYVQSLYKATEAVEENDKAVQLSISTYDKFLSELEKTSATIGQEAAKVSILFAALGDSNIGLKERTTIIGQLNQISPKYLGDLDKEKASYESIAKAVQSYTESLAISAEIKALLPQVDTIFQNLIKAQVELNQLRRFQISGGLFAESDTDFKKDEAELQRQIKQYKIEIERAKKDLSFIAGGPLSLAEILFGKNETTDKQIKEIEDKLSRINIHPKLILTTSPTAYLHDLEEYQKRLAAGTLPGVTVPIHLEVKVDPKGLALSKKNISAELLAFQAEATKVAQATAVNIAVAIGDSLGNAIAGITTGGNIFAGLFSSIFKALGAGLRQLGVYAITTSKLILAIKAEIGTTLGIAGGVALVALGTLISAAANKLGGRVPGFAQGVRNFGGGVALVGERGPELVNLPAGSDVIPNHALGGIGGGGQTQVFIPEYRINGIDLITVFKRADATYSRNT